MFLDHHQQLCLENPHTHTTTLVQRFGLLRATGFCVLCWVNFSDFFCFVLLVSLHFHFGSMLCSHFSSLTESLSMCRMCYSVLQGLPVCWNPYFPFLNVSLNCFSYSFPFLV